MFYFVYYLCCLFALPLLPPLPVQFFSTGIWLFYIMFCLPFLGYQLTLLCDDFDKVVLSNQGPLALQCSATSNLFVLTKNILLSRYILLIYFLKITLGTSVFAALGLFQSLMSSQTNFISILAPPYYSCLSGHTFKQLSLWCILT